MTDRKRYQSLPAKGDKSAAFFRLCVHRDLSSTAKAVGACLISRCNWETGQCDPSIDTLASDAQVDRSTVFRALHELEQKRLFDRITHGGTSHRNAYRINWHRLQWSQPCDGNGRIPATVNGRIPATQKRKAKIKEKKEKRSAPTHECERASPKGSARGKQQTQRSMIHPIEGGKASAPSKAKGRKIANGTRPETIGPDRGAIEMAIADLLGPKGFEILCQLSDYKVRSLCKQYQRGELDDETILELRLEAMKLEAQS